MNAERILITVVTYPNPSRSHIETVCTAGIKENGDWIRLYPIHYRDLPKDKQFVKFDWISVPVRKRVKDDFRPESHTPHLSDLRIEGHISTDDSWSVRRSIVLGKNNCRVHHSMKELNEKAQKGELSLATYKPSKILDFNFEACDDEWDKEQIEEILALLNQKKSQQDMFSETAVSEFNLKKLPFKFKIKFEDQDNEECNYTIEDWEVGANYLGYLRLFPSPKEAAQKVRENYNNILQTKDVYFFMGTRNDAHRRKWPNPFSVIGLFRPPFDHQCTLGI